MAGPDDASPNEPTPHPPAWPPPAPVPADDPSAGLEPLAVTALVMGIVAIPGAIVFAPALLALILGLIARRHIKADPRKTGKGMATAGIVLGALSLVGGVVFAITLVASDDGGDDTLRYTVLETGDCYDNAYFNERDVEPRSCTEEHRREAFAVLDHPAPAGSPYPGRERLRRFADRECTARFTEYVGQPYEESRLFIVVVVPRRADWEDEGTRRIVCAAATEDDDDLTRSVRDSRL